MDKAALQVLLILCVQSSFAHELKLALPKRIETEGVPIDVPDFLEPSPAIGDFNRDGLLDLFVGEYAEGGLRIYLNTGENKSPRFDGFLRPKVGNEPMISPTGQSFRPALGDWNSDGKLDVLSGSNSGILFLFTQESNGTFAEAEALKLASGKILKPGGNSFCSVVDWDKDQDLDLFVACRSTAERRPCHVFYIENKGTRHQHSLAEPIQVKSDGSPIAIESRECCPCVVDWDHDGKLDLLVGTTRGAVHWFKTKTNGPSPEFQDMDNILEPPQGNRNQQGDKPQRGFGCSICVVDWNRDGRLDLLVGDHQYESIPAKNAPSSDALTKARSESTRLLREYRKLRRSRKNESKVKREFREKARAKIALRMKELRIQIDELEANSQPTSRQHGYIWLFQRNP